MEIMFVIGLGIYFTPAFIALCRDHHQTLAISLLNLFLGWTFVGWVAALVWAATAIKQRNPDGTLA